jgi:hypothetical protein
VRRKLGRPKIDEVAGLDSGSGLLGTASDGALREFSWATYGPISRFESEPFDDLLLPLGRAKRRAALHALAERCVRFFRSVSFVSCRIHRDLMAPVLSVGTFPKMLVET